MLNNLKSNRYKRDRQSAIKFKVVVVGYHSCLKHELYCDLCMALKVVLRRHNPQRPVQQGRIIKDSYVR